MMQWPVLEYFVATTCVVNMNQVGLGLDQEHYVDYSCSPLYGIFVATVTIELRPRTRPRVRQSVCNSYSACFLANTPSSVVSRSSEICKSLSPLASACALNKHAHVCLQEAKQVLEEFPSPFHTLSEGGHTPGEGADFLIGEVTDTISRVRTEQGLLTYLQVLGCGLGQGCCSLSSDNQLFQCPCATARQVGQHVGPVVRYLVRW